MAVAPDFGTLGLLQIRLGMQNATDDELLELKSFMAPATADMISFMNRDPRVTAYVEKVSGQGLRTLSVKHYKLVTVDQVVVRGIAVAADYITFDDYTIYRGDGCIFPRGHANIQVSYTAGDDSTIPTLTEAWVLAVKASWIAKDVNPNATGESWSGVSSEQWQQQGAGFLPAACRSRLQPLVHPGGVS